MPAVSNLAHSLDYYYSRRHISSWLMTLLAVGSLLVIGGCGGASTSSTPTPTGCQPPSGTLYENTCQGSIIVPSVIAVSVTGPGVNTSSAPTEIRNYLTTTVKEVAEPNVLQPFSEGGNPSWIPFVGGNVDTGVAFYLALDASGKEYSDTYLKEAIDSINSSLNGKPILGTTITITGASPDWLMLGGVGSNPVGSGSGFVGGSPDGPPTPDSTATVNTSTQNASSGHCQPKRASNTDPTVYVLDTGDPTMLNDLPQQMGPVAACLCPNGVAACAPLIGDLGNEMPVLEEYDPLPYPSAYFTQFGRAAWIQSHGLAVAEVVHHLEPNAQVVVRTVLNQYGVGDFQTLLTVLESIWQDPDTIPADTIINMSLTIEPPPECLWNIWQGGYANYATNYQIEPDLCTGATEENPDPEYNQLLSPIVDTIGDMLEQGYHIVAAAGNDSSTASIGSSTPPHFSADLPAALCGMIAVAATTSTAGGNWKSGSNLSLAAFSNEPYLASNTNPSLSCLPITPPISSSAIATPLPAYALGVNVCTLDRDGTATDPQMGLWSGTSFATALVSGNLAANLYETSSDNQSGDPYSTLTTLLDGSQYQPCQ